MRTRLANWLADRSGGSGPGAMRAQQALAIGQIGLAVALLVTASLLVESFRHCARSTLVSARASHHGKAHTVGGPLSHAATRTSLSINCCRASGSAGRRRAGLIDAVPLADTGRARASFDSTGRLPIRPHRRTPTSPGSRGYFESIGVPLIAGRTFTAEDTQGRDRVIVINRLLAKQVFGTEIHSADGFGLVHRRWPFQVIGVVGDERHVCVDADGDRVVLRAVPPGACRPRPFNHRARAGQPAETVSALTSLLGPRERRCLSRPSRGHCERNQDDRARIDPDLALFRCARWSRWSKRRWPPRSMPAAVMFALSALMLAAIGVFGVMSPPSASGPARSASVWRSAPARIAVSQLFW